jgi:hypothetical protein
MQNPRFGCLQRAIRRHKGTSFVQNRLGWQGDLGKWKEIIEISWNAGWVKLGDMQVQLADSLNLNCLSNIQRTDIR